MFLDDSIAGGIGGVVGAFAIPTNLDVPHRIRRIENEKRNTRIAQQIFVLLAVRPGRDQDRVAIEAEPDRCGVGRVGPECRKYTDDW